MDEGQPPLTQLLRHRRLHPPQRLDPFPRGRTPRTLRCTLSVRREEAHRAHEAAEEQLPSLKTVGKPCRTQIWRPNLEGSRGSAAFLGGKGFGGGMDRSTSAPGTGALSLGGVDPFEALDHVVRWHSWRFSSGEVSGHRGSGM